MAHELPFRARIIGTGSYVPPRVVTNAEMSTIVDTSDEWIRTRTGIRERHIVDSPGAMGTADMAEHAAHRAPEMAGVSADSIDLNVVATITPDKRLPSVAALLQDRLGIKGAAGFDIAAACAGSLYAMSIADKFLCTGASKRALVIGGETLSSVTNWTDRNTCVLFGDAAGAMIVDAAPRDGPGFVDTQLYLDGTHWQTIHIPAGGSKVPMTPELLASHADRIVMNGRETYKFAVRALTEASLSLLERNGLEAGDIHHVVAHQANLRIIEAISERVGIPIEKFVINIDRYGNTSSASVLLTFDEARRAGRMQPGENVLMLAIGAGMAWGSGLYRT